MASISTTLPAPQKKHKQQTIKFFNTWEVRPSKVKQDHSRKTAETLDPLREGNTTQGPLHEGNTTQGPLHEEINVILIKMSPQQKDTATPLCPALIHNTIFHQI